MAITAIRNTALAAIMMTLVTPATVHAGGTKVENQLVRPQNVSNAEAAGAIKMRTNANGSRQTVLIRVSNVDTTQLHEVWLEQPADSDAFVYVDDLSVVSQKKGVMGYAVRTKTGGVLPFGVESVIDLAGRDVQVRDAGGGVVVEGQMPSDDQSGGKASATVPTIQSNPSVSGKIQVRANKGNGAQVFSLNLKGLDWSAGNSFRVLVETANGSGVYTDVGPVVRVGKKTAGRYRARTRKGDSLPMGVQNVDDLGGRRVEVRKSVQGRALGAPQPLVIRGTVPGFTG